MIKHAPVPIEFQHAMELVGEPQVLIKWILLETDPDSGNDETFMYYFDEHFESNHSDDWFEHIADAEEYAMRIWGVQKGDWIEGTGNLKH